MVVDRAVSFHVLLVEEDPKQSELYTELIREVARCRVDVISRIQGSFDWIIQSNYHLVVINASVNSPVSGLALLEQIKRMSPFSSVILVSEQATVEQAVSAIRMGAEDYLKKPFNVETFKLAVKRGLDRKTVFGENTGVSSFLNLLNSCQMISASLEEGKIFEITQSYLARELNSSYFSIYTLENGNPIRVTDSKDDNHQDRAMQEIMDIAMHASNPFPKMIESDRFYWFMDKGRLTPALFIFRFKCVGAEDFFCVCLSPQRPVAIEAFESRLRMLKAQIEVTGKNIQQYRGVRLLAYMDDATGLYNTRYLNYILDREIAQAEQSKKSFAVLFIDADKFKGINDTHGHLVGTKLLNELGEILKKLVRDSDTVFRYGGDEFVAVLSSCDLPTAKTVAERIRQSVEQNEFIKEEGLNLKFTVSIGVALFPDHASSKQAIIEAADQAMYSAKRSTRNSVTIAGAAAAPSKVSKIKSAKGAKETTRA